MKRKLFLFLAVCMTIQVWSQNLTLKDIYIRDPFILPVAEEGVYYMYASSPTKENGVTYGGMVAYKSKDLKTWTGPVRVFDVPRDNGLTGTVWAPEVHLYNGKYYLFATCYHPNIGRGTQIFVCDTPDGKYKPMTERPITPAGWDCLDGTLYIDNGKPYMVFCHEWVQIKDGEIWALPLTEDLSAAAGEPHAAAEQHGAESVQYRYELLCAEGIDAAVQGQCLTGL